VIAALLDHLWQSTLFAGAIALLVPLFRGNRAAIRYGLWFTASVKFLLPFSLLAHVGAALPAPVHPVLSAPALSAIRPAAVPFAHVAPQFAMPAAHALPWGLLLAGAWALGMALVLAVWLTRWLRLRGAMQGATEMAMALPVPVKAVASWLEPGLVGILRPVILMPRGIGEKLSPTEMGAILAHELCHLRRRDNLTAAIHMLVEALCWFHPLVWWIGRRLVEERELACDESVLADGNHPRAYAEGILKVCRFYIQSPLACASGVSGADLQLRIRAIMAGRTAADLESGKGLLLGLAALTVLALPLAGGMMTSAPMTALARKVVHAVATPRVLSLPALLAPAQTFVRPASRPVVAAHKTAAVKAPPAPAPIAQSVTMIAPAPVTLPVMTVEAVRVVPVPDPGSDTLVCRRPQQLAGSRFLGPRVCLQQSEWQALADRGKDIAPDGRTLIDLAAFEKDRSLNAPSCRQTVMGAGASTAGTTNFVDCF
jgi:beta-lactamase regulating signal transducer with metallopeptidase domain